MIEYIKKGEWLEIKVPKTWETLTVQQLLKEKWRVGKNLVHHMRMNKEVLINGEAANWTKNLQNNDRLQIKIFKEEIPPFPPTKMDVEIVYEDDFLLIANKPPGINTHPNDEKDQNTLLNGVIYYLKEKGEKVTPRHIHRLDRDTSGVILFSKHPFIGSILDKMLEEREISRKYVALVEGIIKENKGTIDAPIGRDRHHPTRRRVSKNGQHAITHFQVIKRNRDKNYTFVRCKLETGRTHQIRVHMAYFGHPILGDALYGKKGNFPRLALHAEEMEFNHPIIEEKINRKSPYDWGI